MILKGIKKKVAAVIIAGGLVLGTATGAQAATVGNDCFPGKTNHDCSTVGYYSSDDGGAQSGGEIKWNYYGDIIITGTLADVHPDGRGPWLVVDVRNKNGLVDVIGTHNTRGNGTSVPVNLDYPATDVGPITQVGIRVCNGGSTTANATYCSSVHYFSR